MQVVGKLITKFNSSVYDSGVVDSGVADAPVHNMHEENG